MERSHDSRSDAAELDELGQPIGRAVDGWSTRELPGDEVLEGRHCRVEPLDPARHLEDLWAAVSLDTTGGMFTYLPYGPFGTLASYRSWMESTCLGADPLFRAIVAGAPARAVGVASFLRPHPEVGVIEVGHLQYSPVLQRTTAATEAMYLMMRRVFTELGYRRYEWKCDSLNAPSRRAADRLGFRFEGIFRQATMYKGRNRDTAWYAIVDSEWPALDRAFRAWLDETNFTADGTQRRALESFR